jgi:predicted aldo/keto reductase-like oxidoreductase
VQYLELAVRYALGIPGVATLNIGVHNPDQVRKNVEMVKRYQPLAAAELAQCLDLGKRLAADWGSHFGPLAHAGQCRPGLV